MVLLVRLSKALGLNKGSLGFRLELYPKFGVWASLSDPRTLNPKLLNSKALNSQTLTPKPLNPKPLPEPLPTMASRRNHLPAGPGWLWGQCQRIGRGTIRGGFRWVRYAGVKHRGQSRPGPGTFRGFGRRKRVLNKKTLNPKPLNFEQQSSHRPLLPNFPAMRASSLLSREGKKPLNPKP